MNIDRRSFLKTSAATLATGYVTKPRGSVGCDHALKHYTPLPVQAAIHDDPHSPIVVQGGFRSGKCVLGCAEVAKVALLRPNTRVLVVDSGFFMAPAHKIVSEGVIGPGTPAFIPWPEVQESVSCFPEKGRSYNRLDLRNGSEITLCHHPLSAPFGCKYDLVWFRGEFDRPGGWSDESMEYLYKLVQAIYCSERFIWTAVPDVRNEDFVNAARSPASHRYRLSMRDNTHLPPSRRGFRQ